MTKKDLLTELEPDKGGYYTLYRPYAITSWNGGEPKVLFKNDALSEHSHEPMLFSTNAIGCIDALRCEMSRPVYEALLVNMLGEMVNGLGFIEDTEVAMPTPYGDKYAYEIVFESTPTDPEKYSAARRVPPLMLDIEKWRVRAEDIEASDDASESKIIVPWAYARSDIKKHNDILVELQLDSDMYFDGGYMPTYRVDRMELRWEESDDEDDQRVSIKKFGISPASVDKDARLLMDEAMDAIASAQPTKKNGTPHIEVTAQMLQHQPKNDNDLEDTFESFFKSKSAPKTAEERAEALADAIRQMGGKLDTSKAKDAYDKLIFEAFGDPEEE